MCGVEVYRLDHRKGGKVVLFCVEDVALVRSRRGIGYANGVLDEPSVNCFGGMRHEDPAFEGRF